MRKTPFVAAIALAALPSLAAAAEVGSNDPTLSTKPERRSGVVVGAIGAFALGTASGYPNDTQKIDNPAYYGAGGTMPGYDTEIFVMGALADVFNFGLWFGYGAMGTGDWSSTASGGGFRVEAYPFYYVWQPFLKDLGISAQFGVGSADLHASRGNYEGAWGTQSFLGVGVFYELRPFKHFTIAPDLGLNYVTARSIDRVWVQPGIRIAVTTGP